LKKWFADNYDGLRFFRFLAEQEALVIVKTPQFFLALTSNLSEL
jgi:hypothetical protein